MKTNVFDGPSGVHTLAGYVVQALADGPFDCVQVELTNLNGADWEGTICCNSAYATPYGVPNPSQALASSIQLCAQGDGLDMSVQCIVPTRVGEGKNEHIVIQAHGLTIKLTKQRDEKHVEAVASITVETAVPSRQVRRRN